MLQQTTNEKNKVCMYLFKKYYVLRPVHTAPTNGKRDLLDQCVITPVGVGQRLFLPIEHIDYAFVGS